jgi:hypothetical protein
MKPETRTERLAKNSSREAKSAARKSNPVKENRIRKISDLATPKTHNTTEIQKNDFFIEIINRVLGTLTVI